MSPTKKTPVALADDELAQATFRIDTDKTNALSAESVRAICAFRDERDWRPFHNLKDLALSLNLEAAELLECFQWTGHDVDREAERSHMAEELADVLIYAVLFADRAGFSLDEIVRAKLEKNLIKYPRPEKTTSSAAADACAEATPVQEDAAALPLTKDEALAWVDRLATSVGEWTADPEGRFTYVRYTPETLALWTQLKDVPLTTKETPDDVPQLFAEPVTGEGVTASVLITRLARLVRLERMRDGLFLEAQSRGVLLKIFAALATKL